MNIYLFTGAHDVHLDATWSALTSSNTFADNLKSNIYKWNRIQLSQVHYNEPNSSCEKLSTHMLAIKCFPVTLKEIT